jgi:hypothetical protein
MSDSVNGGPPAGWYQDPDSSDQTRWWDGRVWTEHRQVQAAETPTPVLVDSPAPATAATAWPVFDDNDPGGELLHVNKAAMHALVWSVIACVFNPLGGFSITGIVLGFMGLSRSRPLVAAGRHISGRATSIWAIIIGFVSFIPSTALLLLMIRFIQAAVLTAA